MADFIAFNYNAANTFLYVLSNNLWLFLSLIGMIGTIFLSLKEQVDTSVNEEQNIL